MDHRLQENSKMRPRKKSWIQKSYFVERLTQSFIDFANQTSMHGLNNLAIQLEQDQKDSRISKISDSNLQECC